MEIFLYFSIYHVSFCRAYCSSSVVVVAFIFSEISLAIKSISTRIMQNRLQNSQERAGARPKDFESDQQNIEIYSTLLSIMSTEILFYPIETILHRIQLQGTRTIIDNLDSGYSVVPILTSYEGATDCYRSTIASEGVSGLYKGMLMFGVISKHSCLKPYLFCFSTQVLVQWFCNLPLITL